MKVKSIKVKSIKEAWDKVNLLFPTDYMKDERISQAAGYDVYYSTADGVNAWISDLSDRLEVNLENGETVNIWIESIPQFSASQIVDAIHVIDDAIYKIDDKIDDELAEITGIKEARCLLYKSIAELSKLFKL